MPRYVSAERESRTDRLVRRGLAFIIEHGFYKTDQGRQHYLMNLRQIVDSVNETAYHGVIHALLTSKNHYKEWERQHGTTVVRPGQLLERERRRWAAIQKQERGMYLIDAELKDQMKYEGVSPNVWILPSKMSIYVTMVPSAEVEFYRKGAGAAANLEKGPDNLLTFRGSKVFETRPFDIDFIGEPRDLLVRERQIGEYFIFPQGAAPADRDIFIYSMDTDRMEKISFAAAYEVAAQNYMAAQGVDKALAQDASTVLLLRPFQTYNMASAVLLKGGLDTGFTAHGHHDFQLTDDVIHKVHIGHYTFYHKSIVKQPKNIVIAQDIFSHSYVSGEGTEFFYPEGVQDGADFVGCNNAQKKPFSEQLAEDRFSASLIPILIPSGATGAQEIRALQNPIDITGHYNPQTLDQANSQLNDVDDHYNDADAYARKFNFDTLQQYGSNDQFLSPLRHLNTVCFQGHQVSRSEAGGKFDKIVINTGHWGPQVYAGVRSVRNGENAFMKDMEYEKKVGLV